MESESHRVRNGWCERFVRSNIGFYLITQKILSTFLHRFLHFFTLFRQIVLYPLSLISSHSFLWAKPASWWATRSSSSSSRSDSKGPRSILYSLSSCKVSPQWHSINWRRRICMKTSGNLHRKRYTVRGFINLGASRELHVTLIIHR